MSAAEKPIVNLADLTLDRWSQGNLYESADASFGGHIGARDLGASYGEVPPGKSGCPFHNHHAEDEMFVILEGEGTYRFGDKSYMFGPGTVLGAPAGGQETAHQIINTGTTMLRYMGFSNMSATDVCEYPDSGKFGIYSRTSGNPGDPSSFRFVGRDGSTLDYWDGEPGA